MSMPREHIWTVQELADHWAVSESTIYALLDEGQLPGAFKVKRLWRIPDSAVAAYLAAAAQEKKEKDDHGRS